MLNFFNGDAISDEELAEHGFSRPQIAPYSAPRAMTAAAERVDVDAKSGRSKVDKRTAQAWQVAAWQFFDQIGEIKFAFSIVGQAVSQARLYPAVIEDPEQPPVSTTDYIKRLEAELEGQGVVPEQTRKAMKIAEDAVEELRTKAQNGLASLLREAAINVSIPGEFYLAHHNDQYLVASTDELKATGDGGYTLKQDRTSGAVQEQLKKDAFVARIWRAHPRFSKEADSSMLGVLDSCEQLVLIDQAMRAITRSRMNAGALFIPNDVGTADLEQALAEAATKPTEDEGALNSVVPFLLRGPATAGKEIKLVDLSRKVDAEMLEQQSRALDRVLAGVDIPKDIVQGLSNARYSNAIVITDEMFKSHVEPLILLLVDALTSVYLRAKLKKDGVGEELINRLVIWYDPSGIVTRPDRSQAANDGYDRKALSAKAWRTARGFSDADAPDPKELLLRLALEKAAVDPATSAALLELVDPDFFKQQREEGQAETGMPEDVSSLVNGGAPAAPGQPVPEGPGEGPADDLGGGDIAQGGFMPPPPR